MSFRQVLSIAALLLTLSSTPLMAQDGGPVCAPASELVPSILRKGYSPLFTGKLAEGRVFWLFLNDGTGSFFVVYSDGDQGCVVFHGTNIRGYSIREG